MTKIATILIPTLGRPRLIKYVLNSLRSQSCNDFEVLLVLGFNDDETIKIAEKYAKFFDIRILLQKRKGLVEAYNEGIHNAHGEVLIFLDDDAIPLRDFVAEHLLMYERTGIFGVSGEVIPAYLVNGYPKPLAGVNSEIIHSYKEPEMVRKIGDKLWNRPLEGQEQFLQYISKGGYTQKNIYIKHSEITSSLLIMGANMSVLTSALRGFNLPTSFLRRGFAFEQIIGYHLWKTGHRMVFNPRAQVYHVRHGPTMTRSLNAKDSSKVAIEHELLFYYLFGQEEKLSIMHRVVSLAYGFLIHIKDTKNWKIETAILKGVFLGNMAGLKWLASKKLKGTYLPIHDPMLK